MINYIWIGLIVLAVIFGVYREATDPPPMEEPSPVVVSFDSDIEATPEGIGITSDVVYDSKRAREREATPRAGQIDYSFADGDRYDADFQLLIPEEYEYLQKNSDEPNMLQPQRLIIWASGEDISNTIQVRLQDNDGEMFTTEKPFKLEKPEKWKRIIVDLNTLAPTDENPDAEVDFPLTLLGFTLEKGDNGQDGTLYIDEIAFDLPKIMSVSEDLESKSWMGLLTKSTANWAELSIELAIHLIGIMMLWLGLMRIAEKAGLIHVVAKLVKPVMRFLFPDIPPEGDAMGAIVMNVSANMLGLGNAATPLGIKAMKELQALNPSDSIATNAQCMLLAINTSSVTVIPVTLIGYRAATGSSDLMAFWAPMIGATLFSTFCAVLTCKILEKLPAFQIKPEDLEKKLATKESE